MSTIIGFGLRALAEKDRDVCLRVATLCDPEHDFDELLVVGVDAHSVQAG